MKHAPKKTMTAHLNIKDKELEQAQAEIDGLVELITLIHKDLKMRADEDGVVNISNFIWERIDKHRSK